MRYLYSNERNEREEDPLGEVGGEALASEGATYSIMITNKIFKRVRKNEIKHIIKLKLK